jgi:Ca2+-binding EF-hand superfamily protein
MGGKLSREEKAFIKQHGFTKKELTALKKDFLKKAEDKEKLLLDRDQFKELFKAHLSEGALNCLTGSGHVDLDEIFHSMDQDRDDRVSFSEMCLWLGVYLKGSEEAKLKHMFKAFDLDGNGALDTEEINNVLQVLTLSNTAKLSDSKAMKRAGELLKKLDADNDGKITLAEWVDMGKSTGLVEELLGKHFIELMRGFSCGD